MTSTCVHGNIEICKLTFDPLYKSGPVNISLFLINAPFVLTVLLNIKYINWKHVSNVSSCGVKLNLRANLQTKNFQKEQETIIKLVIIALLVVILPPLT